MKSDDTNIFKTMLHQTNEGQVLPLRDLELLDLFDQLPVGVLILQSKSGNDATLILRYTNAISSQIFQIDHNDSQESIKIKLDSFKAWSGLCCEEEENYKSLSDYLLLDTGEEYSSEKFINDKFLIYTKIKRTNGYVIITIDSYDDERKVIQSNIIRNIGDQYMLTLYHEINNPISSMLASVDELVEQNTKGNTELVNRIYLMENFIKIFIKNFILLFKMTFEKTNLGGITY